MSKLLYIWHCCNLVNLLLEYCCDNFKTLPCFLRTAVEIKNETNSNNARSDFIPNLKFSVLKILYCCVFGEYNKKYIEKEKVNKKFNVLQPTFRNCNIVATLEGKLNDKYKLSASNVNSSNSRSFLSSLTVHCFSNFFIGLRGNICYVKKNFCVKLFVEITVV